MSELLFGIGQCVFELRRCPIKVDAHCSVNFHAVHSHDLLNGSSRNLFAAVFDGTNWTPRSSRLEICFEISFATSLYLQTYEKHTLVNILKQNIVLAKFWNQLGFQILDDINGSVCSRDEDTLGFKIVLSDLHRSNTMIDDIAPIFTTQEYRNIQPPSNVASYRLTSVVFILKFASNKSLAQFEGLGSNRNVDCSSYIRLVDAVIRSFICRNPMRLFGIRTMANQQAHTLSAIAPSIFIPGYIGSMVSRTKLIEPIAKFLLAYRRNTSQIPHVGIDRKTRELDKERTHVEGHLWVTMANALKKEQSVRHLNPMKFMVSDPSESFENNFNDLNSFLIGQDTDNLSKMQGMEEEFQFSNGSFSGIANLWQGHAGSQVSPDLHWALVNQPDCYSLSDQSFQLLLSEQSEGLVNVEPSSDSWVIGNDKDLYDFIDKEIGDLLDDDWQRASHLDKTRQFLFLEEDMAVPGHMHQSGVSRECHDSSVDDGEHLDILHSSGILQEDLGMVDTNENSGFPSEDMVLEDSEEQMPEYPANIARMLL